MLALIKTKNKPATNNRLVLLFFNSPLSSSVLFLLSASATKGLMICVRARRGASIIAAIKIATR